MQSLFVIESRGQRVLTSAQIADCYNTTVDCIKQNFHANRNRYIEGKHYIALTGSELREFKNKVRISDPVKNESKNEVRIPHPAEIKARYQFDTQFKYANLSIPTRHGKYMIIWWISISGRKRNSRRKSRRKKWFR